MGKQSKPKVCHKCGSTDRLVHPQIMDRRYKCAKCLSKPNYKHSRLGFLYDGTPEWREKSRVSMERILKNRVA